MPFHNLPKTVDEAVERLLDELSLKEKARIAKMDASDLKVLHITFGPHIRAIFGFLDGERRTAGILWCPWR